MKLCCGLWLPVLALSLGFLAPLPARAEERSRTNGELVAGEADRLEIVDKKMNAAYQKVLGILDSDGKAALREAQRKWLAWRDAQANFDAHQLRGGKLWQMELHGSTAGLTEKRTLQLQGDYKRFKDG